MHRTSHYYRTMCTYLELCFNEPRPVWRQNARSRPRIPHFRLCPAVGEGVERLAEEGRCVEPEVSSADDAPVLRARHAVVGTLNTHRVFAVEPIPADRTPAIPIDERLTLFAHLCPAITLVPDRMSSSRHERHDVALRCEVHQTQARHVPSSVQDLSVQGDNPL